jgi:putative tricarboxylic transport membrane protein
MMAITETVPPAMRRLARNTATLAASGFLAALLATGAASAQGKTPSGPIDVSVGSGPGGSPDVIMRNVVKIMTEEKIVDLSMVVQNRPGGAGAVNYNYVIGRPGDENLLLTTNQPTFTTPIMQGTPSVIDQVVPVANFIQSELVFLVAPDSPFQSLKDFVDAAGAEPGKLRIAGAQAGGTDHLATALIEKAGNVKLTYVPFDSGSVAISTFLGGNVEGVFSTLEEGLPLIQDGRARPLAVLSEERRSEDAYKDVPTAKEQGYDIVFGQSWGVALPPGTDPELAVFWEDKFRKVVESKTWQDGLTEKFQRSEFYGLDRIKEHNAQLNEMFTSLMTDVGLAKQ